MYDDEIPVGRAEDLTGKIFGHLTILYRVKNEKNNATLWKAICDCGNECIVRADRLKQGKTTHCGCLTKDNQSKRNFKDLTGKKFGKLTVLYRNDKIGEHSSPQWYCKCDCGNECIVSSKSLRNGTKSCGCLQGHKDHFIPSPLAINEIGNIYGELTVIEEAPTPIGREGKFWKCKCSCGNEVIVWGTALRHQNKTNCGCKTKELKKENCKLGCEKAHEVLHTKFKIEHEKNIGKKFNHLTIIGIDEDINYAICECDICGSIKKINYQNVIHGRSKSCCLNYAASLQKGKDLTGKKFGKLTVISLLDERKNKERIWHCKCDCGNFVDVSAHRLISGNTLSCGCLKSKNNAKIESMLRKLNIPYEKEYKPKDLPYKKFDFFVNNKYIIEYDGEQHFYQKSNWDYEATKKSDNIKNNYCFSHNIPIIRIPYNTEYNENDLLLTTTRFLLTSENLEEYYQERARL